MEAKTRLPHASCPLGKWDAVDINLGDASFKDED